MKTGLSTRRRQRPDERVIAGVACLLFALAALAAEPPTPQVLLPAKVTKVNDGDSIEVMLETGAGRVRLSAIDTPEYDQPQRGRSSGTKAPAAGFGSSVGRGLGLDTGFAFAPRWGNFFVGTGTPGVLRAGTHGFRVSFRYPARQV